ncbi:MAG: hypothetical protein E7554_04075 [Ruminococcaceae bacterium]|nr:hypothetical protein [Oscillospiraceae bacterium]
MKTKKVKNYPLYDATFFKDFRTLIENSAEKFRDQTALSYKDDPRGDETVKVSYRQARKEMRGLGTALISLGCREKHCAVIGGASLGWVYTYFTLMAIGAVSVPLDKEWPAEDLAATVSRADCEYVFYGAESAGKIAVLRKECPNIKEFICMTGLAAEGDRFVPELIVRGIEMYKAGDRSYYDYDIDPDRMASIVFTSGTTGKGKGVMLSQTNIVTDITQATYYFCVTPKTLMVLPPHHTFGSSINLVGHYALGSEVYISSGLKYLAKEMQEQQPSHLILVPLFVENLHKKIWSTAAKKGQDKTLRQMIGLSNGMRKIGIDLRRKMFSSILGMFGGKLEMIICGGAALSQDIIDTFDALGITILNGYGITECAPLISCNRNKLQVNGSVGLPIVGEQVKIIHQDENGEGEICVKGTNVMLGYYKDPEATAEVFDDDCFFKTGDYGRIDENGWLYITGRLKNLIIFSNGKNVYPEEIEAEISKIPGVCEVVVYAGESKSRPDREVIVAEIFPDEETLQLRGITDYEKYFSDEVKKANANMVSYKAVGLVKIRKTEFMKNTSRKITRFNIDKTID